MSKTARNYNAMFRPSSGPFLTDKREKGREFRRRVREELALAESDMVYQEEILDEEAERELAALLLRYSDDETDGRYSDTGQGNPDQVSGVAISPHNTNAG